MRKMRLTLVVAMLAVVTAVSAQVSFGVKGGLNISNFYGNDADNSKMKAGFNIGLAADYEFMPSMAVQSGLFLSTKGSKAGLDGFADATANLMYLQLPVHFAYKLDVTPGTRIVFHAGPYAAYGVGGKISAKQGGVSVSFNSFGKNKVGEIEINVFERFDAGLGLGVGAEFGAFLVDLGWDMGLVKLHKDGDMKNMAGYLSVGYKF